MRTPKAGDLVVLESILQGLLDGLPLEDQQVIRAIVGQPVRLNEYDDIGKAELEFTDADGAIHFLYVDPCFIRSHKAT